MKAATIRQELHDYIENAEEKKLKAIYTMVENEIEEPYDQWNETPFVDSIEQRTREMETGEVKMYSWQEVEENAKKALEKARIKK